MIGIDEAGRGPVIGSMFVACVYIPDEHILPEVVQDSKQLSNSRITEIATELKNNSDVKYVIIEVPASQIDASDSLSDCALDAFAKGFSLLEQSNETVYVDAAHPNEETFTELLRERVGDGVNLVCEHKADETYPVVSAASILAKDAREEHVTDIQSSIEEDIGSGYPSDPTTKEFLQSIDTDSPPMWIRTSWKTFKRVAGEEV